MKVLQFVVGRCSLESSNGTDKTIFFLSRELARLGSDVSVFCVSPRPVIPVPGVDVRNFPGRPSLWSIPEAMGQAILELDPDVVHVHSPYVPGNIGMARFARRHRIPYVVSSHGNLSPQLLKRKASLKVPYKILFERPMLNKAAFVHAMADESDIRSFGVHVPVVKASNGFELSDVPAPLDEDGEVAERFGIPRGKRVFLFFGRLDVEQKGLDVLLEAFARLARRRPGVHLVLGGSSWKDGSTRLATLADGLALNGRVTFCGPLQGPRKFALMRCADVFVHPSRWEAGVPFSVLEALAVGKPCLVTSSADPEGLLVRCGAATNADPDTTSLAAALDELAAAPEERLQKMGRSAKDVVHTEFSWQHSARILKEAYLRYASTSLVRP